MKLNSPYFLYMAEAEGITSIVNTRLAKLNHLADVLCDNFINPANISVETIIELAEAYDIDNITLDEIRYVTSKI